jgi:hypothetical protein
MAVFLKFLQAIGRYNTKIIHVNFCLQCPVVSWKKHMMDGQKKCEVMTHVFVGNVNWGYFLSKKHQPPLQCENKDMSI